MKKILLIATGGTIASMPTESGLAPGLCSRELLETVPELAHVCDIDTLQLFNLDSTNMCHVQWLEIAKTIREKYEQYDGFLITHGTDTMAYGAAVLSYLIQKSPKPVVLTGAQRSISQRDTDARENLLNAFIYAADDGAQGVHIVFDGKVIEGTRATKTRTKSYSAFSSMDYPEVAVVRGGRVLHYICKPKADGPVFYESLDPRVFVLKLTPGIQPGIFDYLADTYRAVIIESFGVGGIPVYDSEAFADKIQMLTERDTKVIIKTQVAHEGSDMEVYRVGFTIKQRFNLLEAYDMTTEAAFAKTMWALGNSTDDAGFRALFTQAVGADKVS
ncbi:MAG: asparaginase [Clostridia bacterium]|nr:asparaginase [Clostridia bacterium]